jgi:hypothetical protein
MNISVVSLSFEATAGRGSLAGAVSNPHGGTVCLTKIVDRVHARCSHKPALAFDRQAHSLSHHPTSSNQRRFLTNRWARCALRNGRYRTPALTVDERRPLLRTTSPQPSSLRKRVLTVSKFTLLMDICGSVYPRTCHAPTMEEARRTASVSDRNYGRTHCE